MSRIHTNLRLSEGLAGLAIGAVGLSIFSCVPVLAAGGPGCSASKSPACCASACKDTGKADITRTIVERQANVFTSSAQENVTFDVDPVSGNIVAVWDSRRQEAGTYGVYARILDSFGRPVSPEIHINDFVKGTQNHPAVSFDSQGGIWFAWQSTGQDGSGTGIVARRFNADFTEATGEIAVNVNREGPQADPVIASNNDGQVMIAWETPSTFVLAAPGVSEIHARLFNADGTPSTDELHLNSTLENGSSRTASLIFVAKTDEFVLTWSQMEETNDSAVVYAQRYSAAGAPVGDYFAVSPTDDGRFHVEPTISADADGRLAFAWMTSEDDFGYSVSLRRFNADGSPMDEAFRTVAPASKEWKSGVAIATANDGRLAVAYNRFAPDRTYDSVFARFYNSDGRPESDQPVQINKETKGRQYLTVATGVRRALWNNEDDSLILAWNGQSKDGDKSGANLSIVTARPVPEKVAAPVSFETKFAAAEVSSDEFLKPNPPIWDPTWVPEEPMLNAQGDGPDFGFEAVQNTGWTPPDPEMAVGMDTIVVITNGEISAYNKDGSQLWQDEIENSFGFWGGQGATNFVFDPEVLWDPHTNRFMAMAAERSSNGRSMFLYAVSKDSRPETAADWWKYRIDVTNQSDNDIDSPNMAVDDQYVYLTADFFGPDKYIIYVMEKAPLLNGGAINSNSELIVGAGQQSMGIPVTYDANAPAQYIIQSTEFSSNTKVILHAVRDPLNNYSRVTFALPVSTYTFPAQPPQKGTSSRPILFEPRFWSCVYRNGSLWAVHHVNNQRTRARWYEINMNGWPTSGQNPFVKQWGEIDPGSGIYTFFPSINVDNVGNAAITFARSASDEFISMSRALRAADDPVGEFQPAVFVKESNGTTTSGRWGDYSFTQADPTSDGVFWGHHEYVIANNNWRTWVAQYLINPEDRLNLSTDPLIAGQSVGLWIDNGTPQLRAYFTYSLTGLGETVIPQLNVTLEIANPKLAGSQKINNAGFARIFRTVPNNVQGKTVWMQAAENGRRSNVVKDVVQ